MNSRAAGSVLGFSLMLRVVKRAVVLGAVFAFLSAWAKQARAAFDVNDTTWEGGSELFELAKKRLGRDRLEIAATLDYSKLSPKDGIVILHSVGHGPDGTIATVELGVQNASCIAHYCEQEYAQRSVDALVKRRGFAERSL